MDILKEHSDGRRKVRIATHYSHLSLDATRNGYHWTCIQLDPETIELIKAAIAEYEQQQSAHPVSDDDDEAEGDLQDWLPEPSSDARPFGRIGFDR
jgi:hypothetical protein